MFVQVRVYDLPVINTTLPENSAMFWNNAPKSNLKFKIFYTLYIINTYSTRMYICTSVYICTSAVLYSTVLVIDYE